MPLSMRRVPFSSSISRSMAMKTYLFSGILFYGIAFSAVAQVKTADAFCTSGVGAPALRQTFVVIDGNVITQDLADGPSPDNTGWRRFAAQVL